MYARKCARKYVTAPSYLTELCHVCNDDRLRSRQRGNFAVVRTRTRMADGAFTVAGPAAWNALPPQLRNATSRTIRFYHISKLTCTIIILTTSYNFFKVFVISVVLTMYSYYYFSFIVFLNFVLLLCFVLVVYCGAPVLRMRGALANDIIWYVTQRTQEKYATNVADVVHGTAVLIIIHNPLRYSVVGLCNLMPRNKTNSNHPLRIK